MTLLNKSTPAISANAPDWMQLLVADVASSGSIAATARRVGVDRSAVSGLLNQTTSSPYVNGKASTETLADKVRSTIGLLECPFLSQEYGEARKLSGLECQSYARILVPPTQSPRAMQHWRACQQCSHKPRVAAAEPVIVKPIQKIGRVGPVNNEIYSHAGCLTQQAGIIDVVTLPLPEVGAPQIAKLTEQVQA
jgi:hypothetical protein